MGKGMLVLIALQTWVSLFLLLSYFGQTLSLIPLGKSTLVIGWVCPTTGLEPFEKVLV